MVWICGVVGWCWHCGCWCIPVLGFDICFRLDLGLVLVRWFGVGTRLVFVAFGVLVYGLGCLAGLVFVFCYDLVICIWWYFRVS